MPIQVFVDRVPETMTTDVYVYNVQPEQSIRRHLTADGRWQDAGPAGDVVLPTFVLPDDVVAHVVTALGVPMSDVHLVDSLRHERGRLDRLLDTLAEAVTRGL